MGKRLLTYSQAINEAFYQLMKDDDELVIMGIGVNSPWYVGNTCKDLYETFGPERVIDTPVAENSMTGIAAGAAISGIRSIMVHPRMDFMYLAFDQIINQASNWSYMFSGRVNCPLTIRGIVNRGGEQAAQHSQSIHAMFAHVPGLKVVMPANPYDAKGLLVSSVLDENPVIYIDDRWLYDEEAHVPEQLYSVKLGKARVSKKGFDITIIGNSFMSREALSAAIELEGAGISAEVVDLRTVKPIDYKAILTSVRKTGRALVTDGGWHTAGLAADISANISEQALGSLKVPVERLTLPDLPAPANKKLEKNYYPDKRAIVKTVKKMLVKR